MKSPADQIISSLRIGDISGATNHLLHYIINNPAEAFIVIREKELLLSPQSSGHRDELHRAFLKAAEQSSGTLLHQLLTYAHYADAVASVRDELAIHAQNDAELLSTLPFELSIELCCMAVTSLARKTIIAERKRPREQNKTTTKSASAQVRLAAGIWEISGIYSLLPLMLSQVAAAAATSTTNARRPLSLIDAMRAAQRLCRVAEDWQSLADVRQSVAWGFERVSRVGTDGLITLDPSVPEERRRRLANRRRLALITSAAQPKPFEYLRDLLMPFLSPLSRTAAKFHSSPKDPSELAESRLRSLGASFMPADAVLIELLLANNQTAETVAVLFCLYTFVQLFVEAGSPTPYRGRHTHFPNFNLESFTKYIAAISGASVDIVRRTLPMCTWDPSSKNRSVRPFDGSTTPYIMYERDRIGFFILPGAMPSAFVEMRRVLAATNRLSSIVGSTYEKYIRKMMLDAGFNVVPGSVKIKEGGNTITDIDALAHKDDTLIVVQAKHMVEPDSHHANWKARHELDAGIRQCVLVQNWFRSHPGAAQQYFPTAKIPSEPRVFGLVVTPSLQFTGALHGDVAVVDDAYLEHVVYVKQTRVFKNGRIVDSWNMYDGEHPTADEFVELMMQPTFMDHYVRDPWALTSYRRTIGDLCFSRLAAQDSLSANE